MCGLAGFVGCGSPDILDAMTDALAHRGPDARGTHVEKDDGVYLGHRRLSILDLAGGAQPMWNAKKTLAIVYNGEVYNHVELRRELEALGYRFQSDHSDTEVLIHGYDAWGDDLPGRLNGMFAFVIYDTRKHQLFMARDRFGEKPLFYAQATDAFLFGSEISALLKYPNFNPALSTPALQKFFGYGYVPAPLTVYEGVSKLPGGHALRFDIRSGSVRTWSYWSFELTPDPSIASRPVDELAEELRALIGESVKRRLISDVPIGFFLSGGIDSGAVVASARALDQGLDLKTFTVGFKEPSFDESSHARRVSQAFATDHHEDQLAMADARAMIEPVLSRMDEPLGDPSILPTYSLSALTRRHVTVALSGDGGDELFAGYDPFKALRPAGIYERLVPSFLHKGIRRLADLLPVSDQNISLEFKIKRTLAGLSYPPGLWPPVWMSLMPPDALADLFHSPMKAEDVYSEALSLDEQNRHLSPVDRMILFFTRFYLQDDILVKVDRAAMMNSLESRAVFLDNEIADFAARLPSDLKYRNGTRKYLLKEAMRPLLGSDIVDRRKKGFGVPIGAWFRNPDFSPDIPAVAAMRTDGIARYLNDHRHKKADHRQAIWGCLAIRHLGTGAYSA